MSFNPNQHSFSQLCPTNFIRTYHSQFILQKYDQRLSENGTIFLQFKPKYHKNLSMEFITRYVGFHSRFLSSIRSQEFSQILDYIHIIRNYCFLNVRNYYELVVRIFLIRLSCFCNIVA